MISLNFFGTHDFAAGILQALLDSADFEIQTVFTAPDRPVGRHQELQPSPVKILAGKYGLKIEQPAALSGADSRFRGNDNTKSYQLNIVCDYGLKIPKEILDAPTHGSINIHPSLLPKYRGATPIQAALMNGDSETGVSIILMDEKLDHGPILAQKTIKIGPTDTYTTLAQKLLETANLALSDTVRKWVLGPKPTPQPQDDSKATECRKLTREDGRVGFATQPAQQVYNLYRALTPWPGAWTMLGGKRVKLLSVVPVKTGIQSLGNLDPRRSLPRAATRGGDDKTDKIVTENNQIFFVCSDGNLIEALELQLEGKKSMTAKEFTNSFKTLLHA